MVTGRTQPLKIAANRPAEAARRANFFGGAARLPNGPPEWHNVSSLVRRGEVPPVPGAEGQPVNRSTGSGPGSDPGS